MSLLEESIKTHEGLRLKAYQDSVGVWTIGYGCNLQELKLDQATANMLLSWDIHDALNEAAKLPYFSTQNQPRKDALTELVFELGTPRFSKFVNFHSAMVSHDYATASKELLNSLWAKQVGPVRSGHIAQQIRLGEYWNA